MSFLASPSPTERKPTSKEYRPRYYDMCELTIGYFKVEDDVDSYGRFRSKFKVLFTKRLFMYDFPVVKCNQVDLSNNDEWGQMARVLVPFKTVVALNMVNRRINIQVDCCPQIQLWKIQGKTSSSLLIKAKTHEPTEDNLWREALQNSLLHKITLRKRQADNLKTHLCQFDSKFHLLFTLGVNVGMSLIDASPFEEELACANMKKLHQKNKKNNVRRLPQWDSEMLSESSLLIEGDHLLPSNHVCSCRISCRSLRCSCVKAAKSCSTGGMMCLCTSCDNPLNVLESFGLNLDFSLSDCCLFQNIYQIPKLRNFLQRDVKLSCCNTVARVLDCIPGSILCPNVECNACLEFSWCRGIICYPERNPRNHCSFCGLCCFSNGRHCPVCNMCYVVTSKTPECPTCLKNGLTTKPFDQDPDFIDKFFLCPPVEVPAKPTSKPEIVILDRSFKSKLEDYSVKMDATPVNERIPDECSTKDEKDSVKNEIDHVVKMIVTLENEAISDKCSKKEEKDSVKNEITTPKVASFPEKIETYAKETLSLKAEENVEIQGNHLIKDEKESPVDVHQIPLALEVLSGTDIKSS